MSFSSQASADLKNSIDLDHFQSTNPDLNIHYNSEVFPGLFLKLEGVTVSLFRTGKVNFIGARSFDVIESSWNWIRNVLRTS